MCMIRDITKRRRQTLSAYETIKIEKKGQVDWLTLNRPESLNAIDTPMVTELRDYFGGLKEDRNTRLSRLFGGSLCAYA